MQVPPFSLEKQLSEIGQELDSAVCRVINSGHFIGGEAVKNFEASFAEACNVRYSIGCNSGTDALVLALRALDIGPGDEVITTSFSFFATAEAISNVGAKPVFVDVDPIYGNLDPLKYKNIRLYGDKVKVNLGKKRTIDDDKEARTIWWLLTQWNINCMANKSNSSARFS